MRYLTVLQHSEEDCGAACLATVARYYGRILTIGHAREVVGTGQLGTTLLGLERGAQALGFDAQAVKASPALIDQIEAAPLPAIIHWKGYHWVVLYGKQRHRYVVADPGVGLRYLKRQELVEAWPSGMMLLLTPDPQRFDLQPDDTIPGIGRFLSQARRDRGLLLEVAALNLALGVLALAVPLALQVLTDDVLIRGDLDLLKTLVIGVGSLLLFSSGLQHIQANLTAHFSQRLELGLMLAFGRQLLRLPTPYYETHRSGEVTSRLRDIQDINALVTQAVITLPMEGFIALVSLAVMLAYNLKLFGVALAVTLAMPLPTVLVLRTLRQRLRDMLVTSSENQAVLVETFKGAITLKASNAAPQLWSDLQIRFGRLGNLTLGALRLAVVTQVLALLAADLGTLVILALGSLLVIRQDLSIGQLIAFNKMNLNLVLFTSRLVMFAYEFVRVQTIMQRLAEVLEATPEEQEVDRPWVTLSGEAEIVCTDLSFHYPGQPELLDHLSLRIPGGQVTAIVGASGCGKSTLAKLLARLYVPQAGQLRLGNFNQGDLALECWRQQVVLVPQEAHFWTRTILQNFRLSHPQASFEAIVAACQITGADAFISRLPDQYRTILGEFGANLSGGQRQRLALARALVGDPPVLILDESTGALDPASEARVLAGLLAQRQGKTTILISHRPPVVNRADWMIVLEAGQVVTTGSPASLRTMPGLHQEFLGSHDK